MRAPVGRVLHVAKLELTTGCARIPTFLCPALSRSVWRRRSQTRQFHSSHPFGERRRLHTAATGDVIKEPRLLNPVVIALPVSCPGCGAFTQDADPEEAGFYCATRRPVKAYLQAKEAITRGSTGKTDVGAGLDVGKTDSRTTRPEPPQTPVCDRCHNLLHHHTGVSIQHPTMRSIEDTISESPHKYNHVYHVLDAADFPLSLIPDLHRRLSLTPQRSQNRRSKGGKFYGDRKAEMSFIITRSDLLAPRKEQVDGLMPYMLQVLRDALGPGGEDVRLGNVSCVSAKRGWWTKEVKEQIWSRGGGGWMVGKVNVGKSNLFEGVFPKGRNEKISFARLRHEAGRDDAEMGEYARESLGQMGRTTPADGGPLDETSLLPPAQPEIPFPVMPVISSLPGTTASPIRLSYGNGRGELVDLPGLPRGDLDAYVRPEQRLDLVMRDRPKPEQHVLKPGRSLLLGGGLVRITPTTPDTVVLAYPFVPLAAHVTSTEKAEAMQRQERPTGIDTITSEAAGAAMQSAGVYALRWDVTRQRSGPLTSASGAALRAEGLPYRVLSTDVVLEGVGWIELVAQVRRRLDADPAGEVGVEVFTPHGKHVAARRPMGAWLLAGQDGREGKGNGKGKGRPRRSMKGAKKSVKVAGRTGAGT